MKRHVLPILQELLGHFPCVALLGVRQCGKTTLLQELPTDSQRFDLERMADHETIARDPDLFLRLYPERVAIDSRRDVPGRFVITGSSSPNLMSSISESLAGRVALIEMGPLSLAEAYELPLSGFYTLAAERAPISAYLGLAPGLSLEQATDYWQHGGYPEPWLKGTARFRKLWMQNYLQTYLERDLPRLFPGVDRQKFRLFAQMLAQLSGSIIIIPRWHVPWAFPIERISCG